MELFQINNGASEQANQLFQLCCLLQVTGFPYLMQVRVWVQSCLIIRRHLILYLIILYWNS